jgi:hypothetical protein
MLSVASRADTSSVIPGWYEESSEVCDLFVPLAVFERNNAKNCADVSCRCVS